MNDTKLQFILENLEEIKKLTITANTLKQYKLFNDYDTIHDKLCDKLVTCLMVTLGDHIPATTYTCNDYSNFYGNITDESLNDKDGKIYED